MKAFFNAVKRSPKLAALSAALVGVVVVPAALLAWGPDRPTFTMAHPATYVTFNSITDNPKQGDERNFVGIREAGVGTYKDDIALQAGKEYEAYVFYHNNASQIFNDAAHDYSGVATNAKVRVQMPASVKAGEKARVTGFVSASNATPGTIWDEAYGSANADLALRYVQGSAKITSAGSVNGSTMPDSLFTTGANLGYNALDGKVPGCTEFQGWVIFRFKAVAPDFDVTKTVSKVGANAFSKSINANPGDTVEYKIQYKNTGSVTQNNVVVKDQLPNGINYVPSTTHFANAKTEGKWTATADNNVVTGTGINIGAYTAGSNAFVKFQAKVATADKLKCGTNTLVNTATVETDNGSKSDTANVVVNKVCKDVPPELPQTGIDGGILAITGIGSITAALVYAVRSDRFRNLLRS